MSSAQHNGDDQDARRTMLCAFPGKAPCQPQVKAPVVYDLTMPTVAVHRAGSGSPMVLIHGFSASWGVWRPVLPALEQHHDVLVATLLGHSGGPAYAAGSPATPRAMADALERDMDSAGFERAHLVGNSLGGWLALELAARGRALSTTALSPAGGWNHGGRETTRLGRMFRQNYRLLKLLGPDGARLMSRPRFRALALRDAAMRPAELPAALAVEMTQAAAACAIYLPLLEQLTSSGFGELGAIDSPVQIAWGTKDRILRWPGYAERFRRMTPEAQWVELDGLGHCPMLDDAPLTTRTILELTQRVDVGRATAQPAVVGASSG
jgi:pimeloyl-ACP methyl ester carboxylesterase